MCFEYSIANINTPFVRYLAYLIYKLNAYYIHTLYTRIRTDYIRLAQISSLR